MAAGGGALDEASVADATGAVRAQAFAALHRRLDPASRAPLAVGLSGGGDSLALLAVVLDWAGAGGRPVLALTVDHGLHSDSARWTAEAGEAARSLGAQWRPLTWRGTKPAAGLPAAARRARHALLADAARAGGATVLLLGHTADDVAESELIRRETPSHGRLHEWAPSPAWPQGRGVFLLRPLLGTRRDALRSVLGERRLDWLEDPANADPSFARTRARQALTLEVMSAALPVQKEEDDGCEDIAGRASQVSAAGVVSLGGVASALAARRLALAIVCAGGGDKPPPGVRLAHLADRLAAGGAGAATLGGARVTFEGDTVTLCRELGRRPCAPAPLAPGEPQVFDGRFELVADAPGWRVAPLAGHAARLPARDRRGLAAVPAAARPALPVLLDDEGAARLPRPFGDGPARARELVSGRLAAALGGIDSERLAARGLRPSAVHGA